MKTAKDLSGEIFNGILVIERDLETENQEWRKSKTPHWRCLCHCGKIFSPSGNNLRNGIKSCGCIDNNKGISKNGKVNKWIFRGDIAIGITHDNQEFIIDKADYKFVSGYRWRISTQGYVVANSKDLTNRVVFLHRIIMDVDDKSIVDHIDWNKRDNRKTNLRICSKSENNVNIKRKSNNSSGYTGVKKGNGKWVSQISFNGARHHLGTFDKIEDAIKARVKAEEFIHKDFNGEINRKDLFNFINEADIEERDGI